MSKYIDHNDLDDIHLDELLLHSALIKRYLSEGNFYFDDFKSLLGDIFNMHDKYTVYLIPPLRRSVNYEIINAMLSTNNIKRLRLRTVGSISNTYLALKLILDGLFESIRGRSILQRLASEVTVLNSLLDAKANIEMIKALAQTIDLSTVYSETQLNLMNRTIQEFNHLDDTHLTERDLLMNLIDETFDYNTSERTPLKDQISKAMENSIYDENTAPMETLLSEFLCPSDESPDANNQTSQAQESMKTDDSVSEDFKEYLKDEFEEKFKPFLKNQFLSEGNTHGEQFTSDLNSNDQVDQHRLGNQPVLAGDEMIESTAHRISSTLENQLRNSMAYAHSTTISQLTDLNLKFSEDEFKLTENSIQDQLKKLNMQSIISKALDTVDRFKDTSETLGIKEHSMDQLTFDEVIQMNKRFKKPAFVRFINQVGRKKQYARRLQYKKRKENAIQIDKVNTSHNIDLLIEDEYIELALDIEAFENDFYDRYLRDDLLTLDMINKFDKRKGPIILCYDGSGSMEGRKIEETKSHILSILEVAKIQKRYLVLIQFASASEPLYIKKINPYNVSAQDIFDVLDEFICGGTDFEKPLSKAIEFIKADQYNKSDILFITDGQCEIRTAFKKDFLSLKKQRDFKLYTIIMHAYTYHDYGDIGDISDEVLEINEKDIGNWNETTNNKLYSLI